MKLCSIVTISNEYMRYANNNFENVIQLYKEKLIVNLMRAAKDKGAELDWTTIRFESNQDQYNTKISIICDTTSYNSF